MSVLDEFDMLPEVLGVEPGAKFDEVVLCTPVLTSGFVLFVVDGVFMLLLVLLVLFPVPVDPVLEPAFCGVPFMSIELLMPLVLLLFVVLPVLLAVVPEP